MQLLPLSKDKKDVGENVRTLLKEGKSRRQAIAIALSVAGKKKNDRDK